MLMKYALWGLIALMGCSAGSGGGGTEEEVSRAAQNTALEDTLSATNITDPTNLPSTGVARYDGFMTARLPVLDGGLRQEYLGDLTMKVDFAANKNQVSGRADGFAAGQEVLGGSLRIRGGDLFRNTDTDTNFTFTGAVDGDLTRGADAYTIDAKIEGEFRGRDQEGVNGLLFGDIEGPLGQDIFDGTFVAEKR